MSRKALDQLNLKQAAKLIGMSAYWLLLQCQGRAIKAVKVDRIWRIQRSELLAWRERQDKHNARLASKYHPYWIKAGRKYKEGHGSPGALNKSKPIACPRCGLEQHVRQYRNIRCIACNAQITWTEETEPAVIAQGESTGQPVVVRR